ncbi:endospore germination permease [Cytobacillus sp. FJAT-54145]|uniref:Endospore germination permease n=1 Tax=Cytobacillus spartinae TaxID=3299023 RepID=A0ABW6KER6_9BACI
MNNKLVENLSLWQLFIVIFIFELGSAAVVGIGGEAKQDAWIAIAVATVLGIGLVAFYIILLSMVPGKNLFEVFCFCFGKWLGKLISLMYVIYFFYIAARVLRDFCELIASSIFEETPIEVIAISMILVVSYMLYLGLEVLGRASEIFIPYLFSFIIIIGIFILFSGEMEFTNLLPVLPEGLGPVFKAVFPSILTFPFGELIAFTILFPAITKRKKVLPVGILAVLVSGLVLIYNSIVQIATLGPEMKERSNFPLLSAAREISLLEFIERVDLIIVFIVMYGIIVKVGVFFYGGLKGLELIFNRSYRAMIVPIGTLIAFFSIEVSHNFAEHIQEGLEVVPMYFHVPFQIIIPMLVFPILYWKVKKQQKEKSQ